jgi:AraC family transcriptional regulator
MAPVSSQIIVRRSLLESDLLSIGDVVARPTSPDCGEMQYINHHALVLPLAGVFATHFGPRHCILTTFSDAILLPANTAHCYSFPGAIGDHCLVLRWSMEAFGNLVPEAVEHDGFAVSRYRSHAILSAESVRDRELLWRQVRYGQADPLAAEELSVRLLTRALSAARRTSASNRHRRRRPNRGLARRIETVRATIAARPQEPWTLAALARLASVSPYHLAREFRGEVGTPVYGYVVRSRLNLALDAVLDTDDDLTTIALNTGFASHSHFTVRFRRLFGLTPANLRRTAKRAAVAQLRKIATAPHRIAH